MDREDRGDIIVMAIAVAIFLSGIGVLCYFVLLGVHHLVGSTLTFGTAATAALPLLEAGGGIAAAVYSIKVVVNQINKAERDPYKWLVPVLGIFAAFIIDVFKEVIVKIDQGTNGLKESIVTACIAGIIAIMYFFGGLLWRTATGWLLRLVAIIFFLSPLLVAYLWFISGHSNDELMALMSPVNWEVVIPICIFLALFIVTVIISFAYRNKQV